MIVSQSVITDIKAIILNAKEKAIRSVDHERTMMYWQIGQRIFEEEQQGKDRADYGNYLTKFVAEQLEPEYGSGFSKRQIELFRQFYRTFPIANAVRSQLEMCGKTGGKAPPAFLRTRFHIQVPVVLQRIL